MAALDEPKVHATAVEFEFIPSPFTRVGTTPGLRFRTVLTPDGVYQLEQLGPGGEVIDVIPIRALCAS